MDVVEFYQFGTSVSIDNKQILIGVPYSDESGESSGSAYIWDIP